MPIGIKKFTDLETWKSTHQLVLLTYKITRNLPSHEIFGLVSQMNRAAVSVTSNIAEGFGRLTYGEKGRFYLIARGSLYELENQIYIIHDLHYVTNELFEELMRRVNISQRLLNALINKTRILGVAKTV